MLLQKISQNHTKALVPAGDSFSKIRLSAINDCKFDELFRTPIEHSVLYRTPYVTDE